MFDGNGNWTSDFSAQADRDNGIKILASRFDNIFIADIKESFENCLTKDGQIAPVGNFNMGGQRITNLNNGVNDNDAVNMSQYNNAVHKTGNETISGVKTFIADNIIHKNTKATIANPPSNVSYCFTDYTDNNNERIGVIGSQINSDGWHGTYLQAGNEGNIHILTDGTDAITYAPPCDAFGSIVTTTGINKAQNGYVKLGNGIIIQWGWYKVNNSANTTITFPTAFSGNSTYAVSTDIYCSDNNRERPFTVKTKTASNITVYNYFSGGTNYCFIIAIGY